MFFAQKKSGEILLIIEIGSSSVGAALVSVCKDALPKIIFTTRLSVVLSNDSERSHSLIAVISALESVMKTVSAEHATVHKVHVILSSPWYTSATKIIKIDHDSPTLITRHIIEKLTKEAETKFLEESKSNGGQMVEHRIIRTRLNGYNTPDPYNKKAKSVEIVFFASIVATDVLESIRRIVGKYFHTRNSEVSAFSLAAWSAMSVILPAEQDFLIVDVRCEVTDVSLITGGALMKSQSFPQGKNALIQAVVGDSGQSSAAALSLINIALSDDGGKQMKTDIAEKAESFKQTWLQSYKKTLQEMPGIPTIFLVADPDVEVYFGNILDEVKNDNDLYRLKYLNLKDHLEKTSVPADPFLALESIFVTML